MALVIIALRVLTATEARNALLISDTIIVIAVEPFYWRQAMAVSSFVGSWRGTLADIVVRLSSGVGVVGPLLGVLLVTTIVPDGACHPCRCGGAHVSHSRFDGPGDGTWHPGLLCWHWRLRRPCLSLRRSGTRPTLMVHGPGGYRFGDYAPAGGALTVLVVPTILAAVHFS